MLSSSAGYSEKNPWMRHFIPASSDPVYVPPQKTTSYRTETIPLTESAPSLFSTGPPNYPNRPATLAPTLHKLSRPKKKPSSESLLPESTQGITSQSQVSSSVPLKVLQKKFKQKRASEPYLDASGRYKQPESIPAAASVDGALADSMRQLSVSRRHVVPVTHSLPASVDNSVGSPDPCLIEHELQHQNLYKTELCRSFVETGTCRYALKCQFAHGKAELRPVMRHPKYKTEMCKTWASIGTCPYGTRCRFIHPKDDFGSGFVQMQKIVEKTSEEEIPRPLSNSGSRLSVFTEISQEPLSQMN